MTSSADTPAAAEAERYLKSLELFGMRFGLDRMQRLMTALDSPQRKFATVHVVGTNGKTSTTQMVAAILRAHGLRTGAYTSPDLTGFHERIQVEGSPIEPGRFAATVVRVKRAAELVDRTAATDDCVTQFEALTAAAYLALADAGVEVAVVEAGLGGRFDATSVIDSKVQVLTNVGLEHTRWLGPTEELIAGEKLAVIREGGCLVAGYLSAATTKVAERTASERGASCLLAGRDFDWLDNGDTFAVRTPLSRFGGIELKALGDFQRRNFAVAVCAAEQFRGGLESAAVREAARQLVVPGRLEVIGREPLVVLDGAHNTSGVAELVESLPAVLGGRRLVGCVSILDDKDPAEMLSKLLPLCDAAVFTRSGSPRSLPPATLGRLCEQLGGPPHELEADCMAALARAKLLAGTDGAVLVAGSIYLLSDLVRNGVRELEAPPQLPRLDRRAR